MDNKREDIYIDYNSGGKYQRERCGLIIFYWNDDFFCREKQSKRENCGWRIELWIAFGTLTRLHTRNNILFAVLVILNY